MFQCIIQQRNGWIHAPNPEAKDVFPGKRNHCFVLTKSNIIQADVIQTKVEQDSYVSV